MACSHGLCISPDSQFSRLNRLFRTVVHDRVVGRYSKRSCLTGHSKYSRFSVSFASPGGEALHTSSTAQEITVITPAASNFEFRVSSHAMSSKAALIDYLALARPPTGGNPVSLPIYLSSATIGSSADARRATGHAVVSDRPHPRSLLGQLHRHLLL